MIRYLTHSKTNIFQMVIPIVRIVAYLYLYDDIQFCAYEYYYEPGIWIYLAILFGRICANKWNIIFIYIFLMKIFMSIQIKGFILSLGIHCIFMFCYLSIPFAEEQAGWLICSNIL